MIILGTPGFLWGAGIRNKPVLPPGYHYIEGWHLWLIAVSPQGRHYYVTDTALYRQCVRAFTLAYFVDMDEEIQLPQKQLT